MTRGNKIFEYVIIFKEMKLGSFKEQKAEIGVNYPMPII